MQRSKMSIQQLPLDAMRSILMYLNLGDLARLSGTSRGFHEYSRDDRIRSQLWDLFIENFGSIKTWVDLKYVDIEDATLNSLTTFFGQPAVDQIAAAIQARFTTLKSDLSRTQRFLLQVYNRDYLRHKREVDRMAGEIVLTLKAAYYERVNFIIQLKDISKDLILLVLHDLTYDEFRRIICDVDCDCDQFKMEILEKLWTLPLPDGRDRIQLLARRVRLPLNSMLRIWKTFDELCFFQETVEHVDFSEVKTVNPLELDFISLEYTLVTRQDLLDNPEFVAHSRKHLGDYRYTLQRLAILSNLTGTLVSVKLRTFIIENLSIPRSDGYPLSYRNEYLRHQWLYIFDCLGVERYISRSVARSGGYYDGVLDQFNENARRKCLRYFVS